MRNEPIERPNLILGIVDKLPFLEINRFLTTLRQSGFDGHVCLFAGPRMSRATLRAIRARGVEIVRYGKRFPFIADPHPDSGKQLPEPIHIYNFRHFLYRDYLLRHAGAFRNVMITDVRDVVFQRNPFDLDLGNCILVAMESKAIPIGACDHTAGWLRAGYDEEVVRELEPKELSCAGTTIAPAPLMMDYLDAMLGEIRSMRDAVACVDQAAHNKMVHSGSLSVRKTYNFEGPILTLGTESGFEQDPDGNLTNRDGSVVHVIHQYDRHPELVNLFDRRTIPSVFKRRLERMRFRALTATRRVLWRIKVLLLPS